MSFCSLSKSMTPSGFCLLLFCTAAAALNQVQLAAARDFYETLCVSRQASDEHIKKAYRGLSKLLHPDKTRETQNQEKIEQKIDATEQFRLLRVAYEVLSDEEKRASHDRLIQNKRPETQTAYTGAGETVVSLTAETWDRVVGQRRFLVAVEFYVPWCAHFGGMREEWKALGGKYKDVVTVAAVNCATQQKLCEQQGVYSYSTIRLYLEPLGEVDYEEYASSDLTVKGFAKWVLTHTPQGYVSEIADESAYAAWLETEPEVAKAVVFADKRTDTRLAVINTAAREVRGRLSVGVVFRDVAGTKFLSKFKLGHNKAVSVLFVDTSKPFKLQGEWRTQPKMTKELLLETFERRIAQHEAAPYSSTATSGGFRKLTAQRMLKGDCMPTDPQFCFVHIRFGDLPRDNPMTRAMHAAAEKYKRDPVKFVWVDGRTQPAFVSAFQLADLTGCTGTTKSLHQPECAHFIMYRPKRNEFLRVHFPYQELPPVEQIAKSMARDIEFLVEGTVITPGPQSFWARHTRGKILTAPHLD